MSKVMFRAAKRCDRVDLIVARQWQVAEITDVVTLVLRLHPQQITTTENSFLCLYKFYQKMFFTFLCCCKFFQGRVGRPTALLSASKGKFGQICEQGKGGRGRGRQARGEGGQRNRFRMMFAQLYFLNLDYIFTNHGVSRLTPPPEGRFSTTVSKWF